VAAHSQISCLVLLVYFAEPAHISMHFINLNQPKDHM